MAAEAQVEETGETGWLRRDGAVLLCGLVRPALMERPVEDAGEGKMREGTGSQPRKRERAWFSSVWQRAAACWLRMEG
ncbi:hypothetical protein H0E87_020819 [Populus deltoides]|uniref:Uncharacterized protein n=1 Tax=Populus deltoides TaxID=3696 RepID=A0A8T2XP45_POPDE|nr:hypothetical protein H0E87_020819 [Populus deltoides]